LVHQLVPFGPNITARFDDMCNVLFRVAFTIKSVEFKGWVAMGHTKDINPFRTRHCV